jgi:hypothetical protein
MTPKDSHRTAYAVRRADALSAAKLCPGYFHLERLGAIRAISEAYEGDRRASLLSIADFRRDQRQIRPGDEYLGLANVQPNTGEHIESTEADGEGAVLELAAGGGNRQEFLRLEAGAADQGAVDIATASSSPALAGFTDPP